MPLYKNFTETKSVTNYLQSSWFHKVNLSLKDKSNMKKFQEGAKDSKSLIC